MRKILLVVLFVFIYGCDGFDDYRCLQSVEKEFPKSQIANIQTSRYRFVIKTADGAIWYAETMNLNEEISYKKKLFNE